MWGDDPALKLSDFMAGTKPVESWVNPDSPIMKYRGNPPSGVTPPKTTGWAGRGNGPVDNSLSSCLSCHGTSQMPVSSPLLPPNNLNETQKLRWFRNLAPNEPFDAGNKSLDFSLQLAFGIQNLHDFQNFVANLGGMHNQTITPLAVPNTTKQFRITRDAE
ncbi:MAG: hypothetical protein QM703_13070 [Gemmatales bacterium]